MRTHRFTLVLLLPAALAFAGCEKRVVAVRDGWMDGTSPAAKMQPPPSQAKPKGFLENVGEFLFGWTRVFEDKPKPEPAPDTYDGWHSSQPAMRFEDDPEDQHRGTEAQRGGKK